MANLADIAAFVQVVDTGSFTAAAEQLGVSKAVVSKYVSRLEARLGARLLQRTTRRLTLTEALAVGPNERGHELGARSPHGLLRRAECRAGTTRMLAEIVMRETGAKSFCQS